VQKLLGFVAIIFATSAFAADKETSTDLYTTPKLVAVQNRSYNLNKNFSGLLGYLPSDAFTKAVTLGGAYTYYFSDFTGWEVLNANYAFKIDTGLKKDLLQFFNAQPENDRLLDFVEYYFTSNLVYTPLYNKNLLFNKEVVYGETSFVIGGGIGKFYQAGFQPIVGGGLIFKYFVSQSSSIKLDIRELVYFDSVKGTTGMLDLKVGYDILLGDTPRMKE
jgi:outer membrane beta-barrel protein